MPVKAEELSMMAKEPLIDDMKSKGGERLENNMDTSPSQPPNDQKPPIVVHSHPANANQKDMMNKTVNIGKDNKMNLSLVDQRQVPPQRARVANAAFDQSVDKSKIHVLMETSQAERYAGINVSYENSFSAIKKDIFKETVDKKKNAALTKEIIPIEEKPNKPKDKFIVKNMNNSTNGPDPYNLN